MITQINLFDLVTKDKDFIREKKLSIYNGKLNPFGRISILLDKKINYYGKDGDFPDLITNPVIKIELMDEKLQEFELDLKNLIQSIGLEVGGSQIDKIYKQQILMYQKIYGLEVTKSDLEIDIPIPIQAMLEKFGGGLFEDKKKYHETRIVIDFGSTLSVGSIKSIGIEYEAIKVLEAVDYHMILSSNIQNELEERIITNSHSLRCKETNITKKEEEFDPDKNFFVKIKQIQFYGAEKIVSNEQFKKFKLNFNHPVTRMYFYFGNEENFNTIYKTEPFDYMLVQANGHDILEYSYEQVVANTKKIKDIPDGIYVIDWIGNVILMYSNMSRIDNITVIFYGLYVPNDIHFYICAESINYLRYKDNMAAIKYFN